jgi:Cu2+-exporting ATPase
MLTEILNNVFTKTKHLVSDAVSAVTGQERQQQQLVISPGQTDPFKEYDQQMDHYLLTSAATLGSSVIGLTVFPPFKLVGGMGVLYLGLPIFKRSYEDLQNRGRLTTYMGDAILTIGMLATGHLLLAAGAAMVGGLALKLLAKTEDRAEKQLINVFGNQPRHVWVVREAVEVQIPFEQLQVGDQVVVNAGEIIPVDGIITKGLATVDQHLLTGEAQPVEKEPGNSVFAATTVLTGRLFIEVKQTGQTTVAAQIGQILNNAKDYKDTLQARGEKISDDFTPPTLLLSVLTWPLLGVNQALTIMWSGLGYNMRFLGMFSVLNFLQILSREGVLIKDGRALESLQQVNTIIFDKTGTLTLEQPHVGELYPFGEVTAAELLIYAATAEYRQPHPIAKAILTEAKNRGLPLPAVEEAAYEVGYGIQVKVNNTLIRVGSARFLTKAGIVLPDEAVAAIQGQAEAQGYSLVYVGLDDRLAGVIELQPTLRPEAKAILQQLHERQLETYIISGDHEPSTRRLAEELGIDHYFAETLPENKAALVDQLREAGKFVCFVGDGINDSIALKKAHVSISLRGASTAATDTAQIILMDGTLNHLCRLFEIADEFEENMQVNLMTSIIPGMICIGGVYFLNFGLLTGAGIYYASMAGGLTNTMLPLWKHQEIPKLPPP